MDSLTCGSRRDTIGPDWAQERLWLAWACLTCPKPRGLSIPPHQPGDSPPVHVQLPHPWPTTWFQLVLSKRAGRRSLPMLPAHTWFTGADQGPPPGLTCLRQPPRFPLLRHWEAPLLPGPALSVPPLRGLPLVHAPE